MNFTKRIKHHISMGNYEFIEVEAEVSYDTEDAPLNAGFLATADDDLQKLVSPDIADARDASSERKSYINRMFEEGE